MKNPSLNVVFVSNLDGSVTACVSGTWTWVGQNCAGRYGEGWSVDWWGTSTSRAPNPNFSLTDATVVTGPATTSSGTVSAVGSIQLKNVPPPPAFFHVGQYYSGQDVNSAATCTNTGRNSNGSWSASATYPSGADIPAYLCVNMYDEHGSEGKASNNPSDFSPVKNGDNPVQTNAYVPNGGSCVSTAIAT